MEYTQIIIWDQQMNDNTYNKIMMGPKLLHSPLNRSYFKFFPTEIQQQLQAEVENPESNLQKILNIQKDGPVREYKGIIQTQCENYNFEKNIIERTMDEELPKEHVSYNRWGDQYKNYEQVIKYSQYIKQQNHFKNQKFLMKSPKIAKFLGVKRLEHIVEDKKNQLLLEQTPINIQQQKALCILNDNQKRQKLFEEAILIERLQQIKKRKNNQDKSLKRPFSTSCLNRKQSQKTKRRQFRRLMTEGRQEISTKIKNINPKHMRLLEQCRTEEDFYRNRYICNQRKLRFYNYAYKIQRKSLKAQKQQNSQVIKTILDFNDKVSNNNDTNQYNFIREVQKLFLKYSNRESQNPQQLYSYISQQKLQDFINQFNFSSEWESRLDIQEYLKSVDYKIAQFQFMEILFMLGNKDNSEMYDFNKFLEQQIFQQKKKIIPPQWNKLRALKSSCKQILKYSRYPELIKVAFQTHSMNRTQSIRVLNFNQFLQLLWHIKLFPTRVSKKFARFIYLYGCSDPQGLTLQNLQNVLLVASLNCAPKQSNEDKIKWVVSHLRNNSEIKKK